MKRLLWVVTLLVVCGTSVWGQPAPQPIDVNQLEIRFSRVDGRPQSYYTTMAVNLKRQLNLTDEEAAKVTAKIDAMNAKLESMQAEFFGVGTTRIPQGGDKLLVQLNDLVRECAVAVDKELTEEQSLSWETSSLQSLINSKITGIRLTPEQNAKLQALATEMAKQLVKAPDGKSYGEIQEKTVRRFVTDILTDEQFSQLLGGQVSYTAKQSTTPPRPARPADAVKDLP